MEGNGSTEAESSITTYIHQWCQKYGLALATADALYKEDINSPQVLMKLNSDQLQELNISLGQRCLLRGALLQFKESDLQYAAFRAKKTDPHKAQELERIRKGEIVKMDRKDHGIPEEEMRKRIEMRKRLRKKRTQEGHGGLSLAERILLQRRIMAESRSSGGTSLYLGSKMSLGSGTSDCSTGSSSGIDSPKSSAKVNRQEDTKAQNDSKNVQDHSKEDVIHKKTDKKRSKSKARHTTSQYPITTTNDEKIKGEKEKLEKMEAEVDTLLEDLIEGKVSQEKGKGKEDVRKANEIMDKNIFDKEELDMVERAMDEELEELDKLTKT